jgi:hypothetical protein
VTGLRFFVFGGAILIATGLLQLLVRPRGGPRERVARLLDRPVLWAIFCVAVGVLAVLIGLGVVPLARLG